MSSRFLWKRVPSLDLICSFGRNFTDVGCKRRSILGSWCPVSLTTTVLPYLRGRQMKRLEKLGLHRRHDDDDDSCLVLVQVYDFIVVSFTCFQLWLLFTQTIIWISSCFRVRCFFCHPILLETCENLYLGNYQAKDICWTKWRSHCILTWVIERNKKETLIRVRVSSCRHWLVIIEVNPIALVLPPSPTTTATSSSSSTTITKRISVSDWTSVSLRECLKLCLKLSQTHCLSNTWGKSALLRNLFSAWILLWLKNWFFTWFRSCFHFSWQSDPSTFVTCQLLAKTRDLIKDQRRWLLLKDLPIPSTNTSVSSVTRGSLKLLDVLFVDTREHEFLSN